MNQQPLITKTLTFLCSLFALIPTACPAQSLAQAHAHAEPVNWPIARLQEPDQLNLRAKGIIEGVHSAAERAGSQLSTVRIRAKAARLIWKIDPELGRLRFTQLWEWAGSTQYTDNNQDQARLEILQQLFQCDSSLASALSNRLIEDGSPQGPLSLSDRLNGKSARSRLYNNLAARALDAGDNIPLAATMLDTAFSDGYSYQSHATLRRLTEIDPRTGHQVAARLLESLQSQQRDQSDQSVIAAQLLFEYFFPRLPGQNGQKMAPVDPALRRRYYLIARSILQRSLLEPSTLQGLQPGDGAGVERRLYTANQAMLAASLNSIVAEFEDPKAGALDEMKLLAERLSSSLPPEFAGMRAALDPQKKPPQPPLRADTPPEEIVSAAIARGDLQLASSQVGQIRNDSVRSLMQQMLFTALVRSAAAKKELAEALTTALKIENPPQRTLLLGDIVKAARAANEPNFTSYIVSLIINSSSDWAATERKAEFLLDLTEVDRSTLLIDASINCLNSLTPEADRLMISGSFQRAFLRSAKLDFDGTLDKLSDLKSTSLELMARLASCEALLTQKLGK
jgi:hypothetical protein